MFYYFYYMYLFFMIFILGLLVVYLVLMESNYFFLELIIFFFQLVEMKIYFYFDSFSLIFLLIVSLISLSIFFFSKFYMGEDKYYYYFLVLTFFFIFSMFLVIMSMNMWLILWGWDGLGVVSYLLVIYYYSDYSNYSGMVTILINRLGDVGMILSLFFLMNLGSMDIMIINKENLLLNLFFFFMVFGVFTKSAQFPFSIWLPLAMAAPTPISALVHSSTLVTAGVYLLIRFNFLVKNYFNFTFGLFILSLVTIFMAGFSAMFELDIKKVIALSTLSQLSLMFLIVFVGNEIISFYHILTHALFKALLFMCSGVFIHEFLDNQDIRMYKFIEYLNPLVVSMFLICNFSLMGLPFLSGFYSKDLILEFFYMMNLNLFVLVMVIFSILFTFFYSIRLVYFSLVMGKKGFLFIYFKNWETMNCSLFMMIYGVYFLGSLLNWIFIFNLEIFILKFYIKMFNLLLVILGVIMSYFFINKLKKKNFFFFSLFFMNNFFMGLSGLLVKQFFFWQTFTEFYISFLMIMKTEKLLKQFLSLFIYLKIILFYMIFLLMFYMIFY